VSASAVAFVCVVAFTAPEPHSENAGWLSPSYLSNDAGEDGRDARRLQLDISGRRQYHYRSVLL
jgi:hypothetical protein